MEYAQAIAETFQDVVTSGSEGYSGDNVHNRNSLHYDGLAIDLRLFKENPLAQAQDYADAGYTVLRERNHLHVSYDPEGIRK